MHLKNRWPLKVNMCIQKGTAWAGLGDGVGVIVMEMVELAGGARGWARKTGQQCTDSAATAVLQEPFHTAHAAVAPLSVQSPFLPWDLDSTVAVTKPVIRPVPSLRIHLQAQPPSWCNMLLRTFRDPGVVQSQVQSRPVYH